jgi:8-oxo-dGTP pyrophosphatase MutT (NUDIX family)
MRDAPTVVHVDRLDLAFAPRPWPFAVERRADIDAFFAALQRKNPALWNGRVLMLRGYTLADGVFKGEYLETDYASFAAWQNWGRPPVGVYDCFSAAAVRSSDGAFLLGMMGENTLNAGKIYFPCGTPDPSDIAGRRVDLEFSVRRELKEETGFDVGEFIAEPGWSTVFALPLVAHIKLLRSQLTANALRARSLQHLARENKPELCDIRIVRRPADLEPAIRDWAAAFLAQHLGAR